MRLTVVTAKLRSRSHKHKGSVKNCDCEKNKITKHCWEADHNFSWDQKKFVDGESRLIPRKIKETIHSLKNPNCINKISCMLHEIQLTNLRQFFTVAYLCHIFRFSLMKLTQNYFGFRKALLSINFNQPHCTTLSHSSPQVLLLLSRFAYFL